MINENKINHPPLQADTEQYDTIADPYSDLAVVDPSKQYVQYPSALRLLGEDLKNKRVLDIGCGDGIFTRRLALNGAQVVGYDDSNEQITKAQAEEEKKQLGINYVVANHRTFTKNDSKFDKAVSVMVLLYAENKEELKNFFLSAFNHLKDGSEFVSITFNPNFKRKGETVYNRRFSETGDGKMEVEFINKDNRQTFSASFSKFSVQDYEEAAKEAGFKELHWENLEIEEEGKKKMGEEFWAGYEDDCPYIGLIVKK